MTNPFLHLILAWPTVLYTVLLALIVSYWLFMALGIFSADSIEPDLDLDLELDADLDIDIDADVEIDADLEGDAGELADTLAGGKRSRWYPLKTLLVWFNVGKVPLLFLLSIATVFAWGSSAIMSNSLVAGSLVIFLLAGLIGAVAAKILSWPFIPLFRSMSQDVKDIDYIGTTGKIILAADANRFGQMEVLHAGDYLLVHVKPASGLDKLAAGSRAVIIGKTDDQRYYVAEPEPEGLHGFV